MRTRFAACLVVLAIVGAAPLPAFADGESTSSDFNPALDAPEGRQAMPDRAACADRHAVAPAELRERACRAGRNPSAHRC